MRRIIGLAVCSALAASLLVACSSEDAPPGLSSAELKDGETAYVVEPGDTLAALAAEFGVPLADLIAANDIEDPSALDAGSTLVVPASAANPPEPATESVLDRLPLPDVERDAVLNGLAAGLSLPLAVLLFFGGRAAFERARRQSWRTRPTPRVSLPARPPRPAAAEAPPTRQQDTPVTLAPRTNGATPDGPRHDHPPAPLPTSTGQEPATATPSAVRAIEDEPLPPPPPRSARRKAAAEKARGAAPAPQADALAGLQSAANEAVGRSGSALKRLGSKLGQAPRPSLPSLPTHHGSGSNGPTRYQWLEEGRALEEVGLLSEAEWKYQYGLEEAEREGWTEAAARYRAALQDLPGHESHPG